MLFDVARASSNISKNSGVILSTGDLEEEEGWPTVRFPRLMVSLMN